MDENKFVLKLRFGSSSAIAEIYNEENPYDEFTFDTENEMTAFLDGVCAMDGWMGFEQEDV